MVKWMQKTLTGMRWESAFAYYFLIRKKEHLIRGTSWVRETESDAESGEERPRSRWRSKDWSRWSAVDVAELWRMRTVDVLILRWRSLMI